MKIGSLIKKLRVGKEMTQVQLADRMDITQNYISLIETNTKVPSKDIIKKFSNHFNISEEALLFLSTEPPSELDHEGKKAYIKLQHNILSLVLFEMTGVLEPKSA